MPKIRQPLKLKSPHSPSAFLLVAFLPGRGRSFPACLVSHLQAFQIMGSEYAEWPPICFPCACEYMCLCFLRHSTQSHHGEDRCQGSQSYSQEFAMCLLCGPGQVIYPVLILVCSSVK